jgi:methionine-rich copper-binding protein CopC
LVGSTPEDGATVETLPTQVTLEFSEEVGTPAFVEVTASDGTVVGDGEPDVLAATVTQSLSRSGPSGTYTIAYRVVSADGHSISGELTFDVTSGPPPAADGAAPVSAESDDSDEGFFTRHVEHFALAAVGIVAGAWLVRAGWRGRS